MSNLGITETITYYHFLNTLYYVYLRHLQVYRCHDIAISLHFTIFLQESTISSLVLQDHIWAETLQCLYDALLRTTYLV